MADQNLEIQHLPRSCHEVLILAGLADRRMHGYEISLYLEEKSNGAFVLQYGTLYPILHRLEKSGHIQGTWVKEGPKRKRKYYALTGKGRRYARSQVEAWRGFTQRFFDIAAELAP
ncbi:PadR family transcriptional regulator [Gemmatimonadota bacterium]